MKEVKSEQTVSESWESKVTTEEKAFIKWFTDPYADPRICLAFTQTFKYTLEEFRPRQQLRRILSLFDNLTKCFDFICIPEFTLQGRIHLHGVVKQRDPIKWYKSVRNRIQNMHGFSLVKKIDNMNKWLDYMFKDADKVREILRERFSNGMIDEPYMITHQNYKDIEIKPKSIRLFIKKSKIKMCLEDPEVDSIIENLVPVDEEHEMLTEEKPERGPAEAP